MTDRSHICEILSVSPARDFNRERIVATQEQMLASWRNLLGGAKALIDMGRPNELAMARRHIDQVQVEVFLAQIFGFPGETPDEDS